MTLDLANKNIILISPKYFNYEKEIQAELERRGAFVYFIDDRIKNGTFNKALFRLKLKEKIGHSGVFNYFKTHLNNNNGKKIDYLIAIIPEGFSKEILQYYKSKLTDTVFILYMWDSIDNRLYIPDMLHLYHKTFTFDKSNSVKYGLAFRPLFYTNDYKEIGAEKKDVNSYQYQLSFIGTAHSDRYNVIKKLINSSPKQLKTFFFFYLQSPLLVLYYLMVDPVFRKVKIKDISFKGLEKKDVLSVIKKTLCIIDINHPKQSGLTIRTLEMLGAKRKLITTNTDIVNYDFYDPDNILVIDRNKPVLDNDFLEKPYREIDKAVYEKYSLYKWVDDVLSIDSK